MAGHVPDGARRAFAQRPTAFGPGATAEPGMAESGNRLGTRLAGRRPLAARLPVPRAAELSAVASEHRRQLIPGPREFIQRSSRLRAGCFSLAGAGAIAWATASSTTACCAMG